MAKHPASDLSLLPDTDSTRLLRLNPGAYQDPITASLIVIDFANLEPESRDGSSFPLQYEAISYTWGTDSADVEITVNGIPVLIRRNLHQCLLRLRYTSSPRLLWNDFLCIAQDDLEEKARQVAMIGKIFHSASRVLIWLGEHEHDSEQLFHSWPSPEQDAKHDGIDKAPTFITHLDRTLLRKSPLSRAESARRANIWMAFFTRRYWRRTWIVQEIALANNIILHCGPDSLPWKDLIGDRFSSVSPDHFDGIALKAVLNVVEGFGLSTIIPAIRELNSLWLDDTWRQDRNVLFYLQHFINTWCTVPHDKVFAFLELDFGFEDLGKALPPIRVNYAMPLADLLVSVYDYRCVQLTPTMLHARWKRTLPEPDLVVASLRLNQPQRMELLRLVAQRISTTHEHPYKRRWEHIYTQLEFGIDRLWRRDRLKPTDLDAHWGKDLKWSKEPPVMITEDTATVPSASTPDEDTTTSSKSKSENPSLSPSQHQVHGPQAEAEQVQQPGVARHQELERENQNETAQLLSSSSKTRIARLRFRDDQYYIKIPAPWSRKTRH